MSLIHTMHDREVDRLREEVFNLHNPRGHFCDCNDCKLVADKKGLKKFTHNQGEESWLAVEDHKEASKTVKCELCNKDYKRECMRWWQEGYLIDRILVCEDCFWDNQYY